MIKLKMEERKKKTIFVNPSRRGRKFDDYGKLEWMCG